MCLAGLFMTLVAMLVELHTVIETVQDQSMCGRHLWRRWRLVGVGATMVQLLPQRGLHEQRDLHHDTMPAAGLHPRGLPPDFSNQSIWIAFEGQIWLAVVSIFVAIFVFRPSRSQSRPASDS